MSHDFWNPFLTGISIAVILMWLQSLGAKRLTRLEEKLDRLLAALNVPSNSSPSSLPPVMLAGTDGPTQPAVPDFEAMAHSDMAVFLRQGKKINAIKMYQEQTGVDLRAAKNVVDTLEAQMRAKGLI